MDMLIILRNVNTSTLQPTVKIPVCLHPTSSAVFRLVYNELQSLQCNIIECFFGCTFSKSIRNYVVLFLLIWKG